MRGPLRWSIALVAASLAWIVLPAAALADGPKPAIESESASNVTTTDAKLEAQIDPGSGEDGFSLETTYEFFLETPWCGTLRPFGACEASGGVLVYKGVIPAGATSPQLESVDLASVGHLLSPDTTYGYRVVATNEAGEAFGGEKTFTTPPPPPPPGKAPVIESVSVSHLTPTDATLETKIDGEGLPTIYQFKLWSSPCSKHGDGCEFVVNVPLPCCGLLLGSFVGQSVSLDLNSAGVTLRGGEYGFSVKATSEGGNTVASGGTFEAPEEGVYEPLSSGASPGPGSGPPAAPSGGSSGSQASSSSGAQTANTPSGAPSQAHGAVKHGGKAKGHKGKGKHKKHKKHEPHKAKAGRRR